MIAIGGRPGYDDKVGEIRPRSGMPEQQGKGVGHRHHMAVLMPVFYVLLLAVVLLPLQLWWHMQETQCPNPSSAELWLERVTGALWITWLTHAAGLMDEALRVFLGIRLTQGLGTPTSVDKVYSKMSRWAEVVAEGIAVDDFPSLVGLYAAAGPPMLNKRASSGDVRDGGGGGNSGGAARAGARVNKSLVMRVEKVAATAQLWSLMPWSRVRRYERVHVKGITLRLRQVNGILNFSFLALNKKGRRKSGVRGNVDHVRRKNRGSATSGDGFGTGGGGSRGMEDPDGIRTDTEDEGNETEYEDEEAFGEQAVEAREGHEEGEGEEEEEEQVAERRRLSEAHSDGPSTRLSSCSKLGFGGRKSLVPWATMSPATAPAVKGDEHQHGGAYDGDFNKSNNGARSTVDGRTISPRWSFSGPSAAARASRGDPRAHSSSLSARPRTLAGQHVTGEPLPWTGRASHTTGASLMTPPSAENVGNLGVFKVLGEAFMRRFNAYCEQVSAAFDRVGDIKLVPKVWKRGEERTRPAAGSRRRKRFEVGEIVLEDVCVCVDAGVWNDLLGDHVGAAFSPEFRLGVKVGPQELLTPNGEGRLAREIGMLINDKLVRYLARLVMRETLKTSTLTSMVITSLALDTDARGRKQGKQNKSLSPPPVDGEGERGALARAAVTGSAAADAALAGEARAAGHHSSKYGRFWRPFGASSSSTAVMPGSSDLPRSGSTRGLPSFLPTGAGNGDGSMGGRGAGARGEMVASAVATAGAGSRNDRQVHNGCRRVVPRTQSHSGIIPTSGAVGSRDRCSEDGSSVDEGAPAERGRGRRVLRPKKSLPTMGKARGSSGWRRASEQAFDPASLSPPPPPPPPPRRPRVRGRPGPVGGKGGAAEEDGDGGESVKSWFKGRRGSGGSGGAGGEGDGRVAGGIGNAELESVAKAPPWMEGVQAHAEYEEMKPTLDVIKQTVLLAVLQQSNRTMDISSSFSSNDLREAQNEKQNGRSWGRRPGGFSKREEEVRDENKEVERSMQEELLAARNAGGDVDRLVMKELLARVRVSGPNTAFKALASIELSSFIENLAAGTRFAQHLENVGIDVTTVAQSVAGLTAGDMMEEVRDTAGKVGGKARRLRTEAMRVQKELLDETGILPLLDDAGGGNGTSIASAVESLSGTLSAAAPGCGAGQSPFPLHKDSWERGVAVSTDPREGRSVEKPLGCAANGNFEEVDEVDVVMQVLDLLEAVESLKVGIRNGDGVALGRVEQAVGKVAQGIDVYLILAASESMLGFLLERLGKLPVGHAKFAGKGVESRVWNLDLEGVQVARENFDLVMKGFRLPKRGTAVMTELGPGKIKRYKKRSRCFVVNLDWKLGNGKPVKAYLQPNDIVVLEGHEGELSDEEEEDSGRNGSSKVTVDHSDAGIATSSAEDKSKGGGDANLLPPLGDKNAVLRAERGRWSSLSRIWGRRKSAGAAETASESRKHDEDEGTAGEPAVGERVSIGEQSLGERGAPAPKMTAAGSPQTKPPRRPSNLDHPARTSPGTVQANETVEELPNSFPAESAGCWDGRSGVDGATVEVAHGSISWEAKTATTHPGEQRGSREARPLPHQQRQHGTRGSIAGPTLADVMSAPFLVARISGVKAELKDVKWSVKQTHFPYLKTAGSLEATVSGLTLELELDTQYLHPLPAQRGEQRSRASGTEGDDGSCVEGGAECADDGSSVGGGEESGTPKFSVSDGDTPKGLRLNRLRVSVRTVKVHVSNSALSRVYNLAASAFEAAVKRYVVESVEAAVRKNITSLLSVVNKLMGQKWDILRSVSGGAAGSAAQTGKADGPSGNAVDKVLATSLSHHVLWAAVSPHQEEPILSGLSAAVADTLGGYNNADAEIEKEVSRDQRKVCHSSRGDGLGSGSSRASTESGDEVAGGGKGDGANITPSMRQNAKKRSFRNRLLEAVGRTQSAGDVSSIDLSSASETSLSVPPTARRCDLRGQGKKTTAVGRVEDAAQEEPMQTSPHDAQEEGADESSAFVYEGRMELPPSTREAVSTLRHGEGGSSLDTVVGNLGGETKRRPLKAAVDPAVIIGSRSQLWSKQAMWASSDSLDSSRSAVVCGEGPRSRFEGDSM